MTIEPSDFDMIALARRGLQALLDEAVAEVQMARRHELWDPRTGQLTPESEEAKATAFRRLDRCRPEPGPLRPAPPGARRGMSDLRAHVDRTLEAIRAQADLSYEEAVKDWPKRPDASRFAGACGPTRSARTAAASGRRASRNAGIPAAGPRLP